ncbi:uncharacterized protein LOC136083069 [Hydra vulgaris]|uniref:Uncharacterized protein LOC136083069 n=1 Tax=Hydra vulgaris TaxID=6087 RepID=A0ABM4CA52_HYDVU
MICNAWDKNPEVRKDIDKILKTLNKDRRSKQAIKPKQEAKNYPLNERRQSENLDSSKKVNAYIFLSYLITLLKNSKIKLVRDFVKQRIVFLFVKVITEKDTLLKMKKQKSFIQNSVRNDMRRLSHLYSHFKNYDVKPIYCNAADMFLRQNFSSLKLAIEVYTDTYSENQKSGLKAALYYLISSSAKKCIGNFLAQDNDDSAKSISDFLVLLQLRKEEIFGDATYDLNERRNISLKKPSKLPIESDVQMIRDYSISIIKKYKEDNFVLWDLHAYVELRDAACTRLVLFNGRRGGEPARLLLREWFETAKDAWLDKQRAEDLTEINETNMKITYQSGKGSNHLVPVLIAEDTIRAMEILSDPVVRSNVGVLESNVYVFPSCQSSEKHCSGWHSLTNVCDKLPLINKSRLTGTTNRHRLSTLMAAINLSDLEKSLVFKNAGHSKNINENIYQAPAAHQQILSTGKHLLLLSMQNLIYNTLKVSLCFYIKKIVDPNGGDPEKGCKFENEATDHLHEKPLKSQHLSKEIRNSNVELNKSPAQKLEERMYTQWLTEQEEQLEEMFGEFIRDKNFGWPSN